MRKLSSFFLRFALLLLPTAILAQTPGVGIGTTAPDASAALDIVSSDKGALLPRLTAATRLAMGMGGVPAPAAGLLVYQTDAPTSGAGSGTKSGFWYNSGTAAAPKWLRLTDGNAVSYDPTTGLQVGDAVVPPVVVNQATGASNLYPFAISQRPSFKVQYLVSASLLSTAGLRAGNLTEVALEVVQKNSTAPFRVDNSQLNELREQTEGVEGCHGAANRSDRGWPLAGRRQGSL